MPWRDRIARIAEALRGRSSSEPTWCASPPHESIERRLGVDGALAELNEVFLRVHASARSRRCRFLAEEGLVIRYAGGELEARFRGAVLHPAGNILPRAYHPLKAVTHALFLAAVLSAEGETEQTARERSESLRAIDQLLEELADPTSTARTLIAPEHVARQRRILGQASAALRASDLEAATRAIVTARADLTENLELVATATLHALHAAVQAVRAEVERTDPSAWRSLLVVVAVTHQSRAEALEVRYFERLLAEPVEEGAQGERRLVVVESADTPAEQVDLLAAHVVDQLAGRLIFAEPRRLQRDVLADHLSALDALLPPPPGAPR